MNVSSQTVSMVLSGKSRGRVAAATRERIEEYVHRTGFRRNMNASRIRRSCCEVITMVQDISNHGNEVEYTGSELLARAFCHELDHLDGKLYTDCAIRMLTDND